MRLPNRRWGTSIPGTKTLVACAAGLALTGCVVLPVPTALPDPEPFGAKAMAPIQAGKTTREEVHELFSHWQYPTDEGLKVAKIEPLASSDASTWVFALNRQMGDLSYVGLVAYFPVVAPVWGGKEDNYQYNWVLVDFNADDTVAAVWVAMEGKPCRQGTACYRDSRLLVMATEEVTAATRSGKPANGTCSLFLYSGVASRITVSTDAVGGRVRDLWEDTFLRLERPAGPATVSVAVDRNAAQIDAASPSTISVPASCADGEILYFELSVREARLTATEVPVSAGIGAIQARMLVSHVPDVTLATANSPGAGTPSSLISGMWTNCAASEGCPAAAELELYSGTSVIDAQGRLMNFSEGAGGYQARRLRLTPGTYTLRFAGSTQKREDTFVLSSARSYRQRLKDCPGLIYSPWCKEGREAATAVWIEDLATSRVVAGEKWCREDADCAESECLIERGRSLGVCLIAGLECKRATTVNDFGAVVGALGRCEPVSEDGEPRDWPGLPNFREAAPPDDAHGLVYIYSPEIQVYFPFVVDTGSTNSPARIALLPRGHYVAYYAPAGTTFLLARRSDDPAVRQPVTINVLGSETAYVNSSDAASSLSLEIKGGETYFVKGVNKQSFLRGPTPILHAVSRDMAMAELKQCRLVK